MVSRAMSGIILVYHRNGKPAEPCDLQLPVQLLSHRGPDGHRSICDGQFAMAHLHFWTTPEDQGERQPLFHKPSGQYLLFDGRIDNRGDLLPQFANHEPHGKISDAQLVLNVLTIAGEEGLGNLIGPFALVLVNPRERSILLARDPVGDRTLFFHETPDLFAVASEENALLNFCKPPRLNPHRIATFFNLTVPNSRDTFFQDIQEIQPGHALRCSPSECTDRTFWTFRSQPKANYRDELQCRSKFQSLLQDSVNARLRSHTPIGVMMSGGLDSTTIAAMAKYCLSQQVSQALKTFSYIFPGLPNCDESKEISKIANHLQLEKHNFSGDHAWPGKDWETWPVNPNTPEDNLFRRLLQGIHQMANDQGCRTLLNGDFGDHHFAGYHWWLWHAIRDGKLFHLPAMLWSEWRQTGLRTTLRRAGLGHLRKSANPLPAPYFTDHASQFWKSQPPIPHRTRAPSYRVNGLLGPTFTRSVSAEIHRSAKASIDLRQPFRDRRLIEFSLEIPAYFLYRNGKKKYLLRSIAEQFIPKDMFSSGQNLEALFQIGLENERKTIRHYLLDHRHLWQDWVKPEWVLKSLDSQFGRIEYPLLWWQCMTFSKWMTHHRTLI